MKNITKLLLAAAGCGGAFIIYALASGSSILTLSVAIVCTVVFLIAFISALFVKDKKTWEDILAVLLALVAVPIAIMGWSYTIKGSSELKTTDEVVTTPAQ
ncbi:hypothetical protein [uncultured Chitinophaga sp.]|uniref:hypothetical protein n=1 Tax=uncultured Chitinophaga sp. TaxID=339340 RepID=UPI0025EBED4F|nr:hypothetical protein [uncultured Chitinophaga sp.]